MNISQASLQIKHQRRIKVNLDLDRIVCQTGLSQFTNRTMLVTIINL